MNQTLIARYQVGGDIYDAIAKKYGVNGANVIADAATSGDRIKVTDALNQITYGNALNDSTASIFFDQLANDPLGAPLAGLENISRNTLKDFLLSPATLLIGGVILAVIFRNEIKGVFVALKK